MARKPGETTADVRARKIANAKAPKFKAGAAPVKTLDKPSNNPPPSSSSGAGSSSSSSSSSSSNNAQNFAAGKVNETKNAMNAGKSGAASVDYSDKYDTSSPLFHTSYKSAMGGYDPADRGGAAFGDQDYEYLKSQGHADQQINSYIAELDNSQVSNKYKTRGGFKMNANSNSPANKARGDGSQYYQSKYNVGYHDGSDLGDDYVSQGALGNMRDYFFNNNPDRRPGEYDFERGLAMWEGEHGYSGDVLKWIDSGKSGMDVTNEQYNRLIDNAENFDWKRKMNSKARGNAPRGEVSASAQYDPRVGGHYTNTYEDSSYQSPDWKPAGYTPHWQEKQDDREAKQWAQSPGNPESPNYDGSYREGMGPAGYKPPASFNTNPGSNTNTDLVPNTNTANITPPENNYNNYDWEAQMSAAQTTFNPYKSNNKPSYSSNMNFNFNPYKFQQGQ